MLGASTTSWSNRFHLLITRFEKKCLATSPVHRAFINFRLCDMQSCILQLCLAIRLRDKIARYNRTCDIGLIDVIVYHFDFFKFFIHKQLYIFSEE